MIGAQGLAALRAEILAEAEREATAELRLAEESSALEVARAKEAAQSERELILRHAQHEAEALRRRARSVAEVEANKLLLEVREQLIQRAIDQAQALLRQPLPQPDQRRLLQDLLLEAAQEIGGGVLTVHVAEADLPLLSRAALDEVARHLAERGTEAQFVLAERPLPIDGGVVLTKDEGRVLVDNSFEARLRRREGFLRREVWHLLSKAAGR